MRVAVGGQYHPRFSCASDSEFFVPDQKSDSMAEGDTESVRIPLSDDHPPSFAVIEGVAAFTNTEPSGE